MVVARAPPPPTPRRVWGLPPTAVSVPAHVAGGALLHAHLTTGMQPQHFEEPASREAWETAHAHAWRPRAGLETGAAPTPACPIRIVVVAALDNKDEPHDLPLAPWA